MRVRVTGGCEFIGSRIVVLERANALMGTAAWARVVGSLEELSSRQLVAAIDEQHSHHLADALPKLRGPALFAETNGAAFRRIEAVTELSGSCIVFELSEQSVPHATWNAASADGLYGGTHALDYLA